MPTAIGVGISPVFNESAQGGGAAPFVGAYDAIPNLVHVYEPARRTLTSYTGPLVRIRRSSDNTQQDFGSVANGDLDTAAIATFVGGGSGFIVTIYDQVGGDDITHATEANQPTYVSSGQNGKPVWRMGGSVRHLMGAFSSPLSQPVSCYAGAVAAATTSTRFIFDGDDSSNRIALLIASNNMSAFAGVTLVAGAADTNPHIYATLFNGASSAVWRDGTQTATGNAGTQNADGITVGARSNGSDVWNGDVFMLAIADPLHDDTQRAAMQTAISEYWSVF